MWELRVSLVLGNVHNLAVSVRLGTLSIDRYLKSTSHLKREIVSYNSKPVPILTIDNMLEKPKDKHKDRRIICWS